MKLYTEKNRNPNIKDDERNLIFMNLTKFIELLILF
jgi:hypothetical protein